MNDKHLTDVEREVLAAAEEIRLAVRFSNRTPDTITGAYEKLDRIASAKQRMLAALGAHPAPVASRVTVEAEFHKAIKQTLTKSQQGIVMGAFRAALEAALTPSECKT